MIKNSKEKIIKYFKKDFLISTLLSTKLKTLKLYELLTLVNTHFPLSTSK